MEKDLRSSPVVYIGNPRRVCHWFLISLELNYESLVNACKTTVNYGNLRKIWRHNTSWYQQDIYYILFTHYEKSHWMIRQTDVNTESCSCRSHVLVVLIWISDPMWKYLDSLLIHNIFT